MSQSYGFDKHVKKNFEYKQKANVLNSLSIVSDQLQNINQQACLDLLVQVQTKIKNINAQYEGKNMDMQSRINEFNNE